MESTLQSKTTARNQSISNDDKNILVIYDCKKNKFEYPVSIDSRYAALFDERPLWQIMEEDKLTMGTDAKECRDKLLEIASDDQPQAYFAEYLMQTADRVWRWHRIGFVCAKPKECVFVTLTDITDEIKDHCHLEHISEYDELTGILNRNSFVHDVKELMDKDEDGIAAGEYALVFFDVLRFKAINDMFGMKEGDRLLKYIAATLRETVPEGSFVCRMGSDKFMFFSHVVGKALEEVINRILEKITSYELPFKITCNMGIYVTQDRYLSVNSMIDRAVLAQSVIKGSYTKGYNYYTESQRSEMLSEQEIAGMMVTALEEKQFVVYYQPQYNHSTGNIIGAEALVRWLHPVRGMISPGNFIPIFEKNGFVTKLDLYVFEQVCRFLRKCIDDKITMVPVSSNFSQYDIFQSDFVESLEAIRLKYDIPVNYLRIEITESVAVGGSEHVNQVVKKLHECGYIVEMDDFGSGYSSLNVLKDIELDMIKLDMLFLSEKTDSNRGGTILTSVVRMAKWLSLPVIAEGVETTEQADFLRSIGCEYMQGYLYSRPLPETEYEQLLKESSVGSKVPQMKMIDSLNTFDFWDSKSQETLIFSNYVGGAAIYEYSNGRIELLRVNKKYIQEIGMNLTEKDLMEKDLLSGLDEENKKIYLDMLDRAIASEDEEECETWQVVKSSCCGSDRICIRSNVRMIGKSSDSYLFYVMIRNITVEKEWYQKISDNEKRFKIASEQVNIYYWEYDVATKEMRPCFRCMRDLGLPAVLHNYPDSAIERGVFPPEVADMYRDWHRQIEEGVSSLEAIIPLTMDRVPFRVKYTTEFDKDGCPVKAYGSAALIKS